MLPLGGVGEDGVDVAEEAQRRSVLLAVQIGDEVGPLVRRAEDLGLKAGLADVALEVLDRGPLVARWVDGVEADQALEHLDALALQLFGGHGPPCDSGVDWGRAEGRIISVGSSAWWHPPTTSRSPSNWPIWPMRSRCAASARRIW